MTGSLRPSSGSGNLTRRKAVCCFLWFIISGLFKDANSVLTANQDHRVVSKSSNYSTKDVVENPSFRVEDDTSLVAEEASHHIFRRKDRAVPPRSENSEVEKDYPKEMANDEVSGYVRKIPVSQYDLHPSHNTLIPRLQLILTKYGLIVTSDQHGTRLKVVNPKKNLKSTSDNNEVHDYSNLYQRLERETSEDSDTLIPYPRQGRSNNERNQEFVVYNPAVKRENSDYILPQIRYGRSITLLSTSETEKSSTDKPHTFVLPYPRPGRSSNMILLYPRQGLSNEIENSGKSFNVMNENKRQGDVLSSIRPDHLLRKDFGDGNDKHNLEKILSSESSPLFLKSPSQRLKDIDDSSLFFVIPYPRPGKKSQPKLEYSTELPSNTESKIVTDYVLPYPRPGKRSLKDISEENLKNTNNDIRGYSAHNFVIPYPRPGRSEESSFKAEDVNEINQMMQNEGKNDNFLMAVKEMYADKTFEDNSNLSESPENYFIVSDYKLDNNYDNTISDDTDNTLFNFPLNKKEIYLNEEGTGYDSISDSSKDNDNSGLRFKRSISVVPYPRLGRSKSIVPYPRLGRSDSIVPYPRPGRSNSVVPYPRLGRSKSIVPYPRLGRSDSIVPYPRPGRSNSVVPYPRLGRSKSIVPYPRLGRSDSIVPYPRPGRSNSIVPYQRLGRSVQDSNPIDSVLPYPRLGRSDSVVPYPRPGRSNSVVPYPRPGRSDSVIPYPRPGRSGSVVPYPRLGRSNSVLPYPRIGRSDSILPYPRPGRSDSVIPYPRLGRSNSIVPYPRLGRSDSVVPYPRPGRSNSIVTYPRFERSDSNFLLPQGRKYNVFSPYLQSEWTRKGKHLMRFQRSGKHSEQEENYILPYPRLGRHSEQGEKYILPYPRPGRSIIKKMPEKSMPTLYARSRKSRRGNVFPNQGTSEIETFNESGTSNTETVIPYPRLGRSQTEVTLSPDISNSVHKLNKHMLSRADDSIYLLPYPRPGRHSE